MPWVPILIMIIAFLVAVLGIGVGVWLWHRRRRPDLKIQVLQVKMPQMTAGEPERMLEEIARSEQLFSALAGMDAPVTFEIAVHNVGTEIIFYVVVPWAKAEFAARQIQGLFPNTQVIKVPDYTIFAADSKVVGGYVVLKEDYVLPIRTYRESQVDTFASVLSTLSKVQETHEGAAIQLVLQPAPKTSKEHLRTALEHIKRGKSVGDVGKGKGIGGELLQFGTALGEMLSGQASKTKEEKKQSEPEVIIDQQSVQAIEQKMAKPLFQIGLRIVTAATSADQAESLFLSLVSSFSQFHAPNRNQFQIIKPRRTDRIIYEYVFRLPARRYQSVLNSEELASIFHFPVASTDVPRISWLKTKEAAPPLNLASAGILLGETAFRGDHAPIRMTPEDRRRHMYIIGQTGTGKTALMKSLATQDIANGEGLCIIDPNGDFIDDILTVIPASRVEDVIVFDPGDLRRPLGLNMLEYDLTRPEEKTFIVNEMQSIFNRLFSKETMGPMFEQYMRNALLLLMEDAAYEPATLVEVPRVFTDPTFRARKLARTKNPVVRDFWEKEAAKATGDASLANMTTYITSKFGNFLANDYIRPIIGQPQSSFNFRQVMDEGKILLVKLSKGRIGDINANLLGMIVTGRLLMAALSRADQPQEQRKDFYFYIDEFQNFTTDSIAVILSEARKYRLNMIVAHQFIKQLEDKIRDSVFGNVGTMVSFRVGTDDAEYLQKSFEPAFQVQDFINIENLNAFTRLLVNGQPATPFNFRIFFPRNGSPEVRDKLQELSALVYGRDLAQVEHDIGQRLRL